MRVKSDRVMQQVEEIAYSCECECCRLLYGDQAKYFEQELKPRIKHSKLGQISMVNNGSNMHGSQVANTLFCRRNL